MSPTAVCRHGDHRSGNAVRWARAAQGSLRSPATRRTGTGRPGQELAKAVERVTTQFRGLLEIPRIAAFERCPALGPQMRPTDDTNVELKA